MGISLPAGLPVKNELSPFIVQMLYSEARLLLQQPKLSVQQISDQLNVSDQSAFEKFFKRKSGLSPKEFRKTVATF